MSNFKGEVRFSILPEWILDASVSDRAIRVYALLARYADSETLEAFPSRQTLAKRAGCHVKSVDRAIEELEGLGALIKTHRRSGEAYTSNLYILRRVATPESLGRDMGVSRVGTWVSPGRDTGVPLTITIEEEPKELDISKKRATIIPKDWEPSEQLAEECKTKFPSLNIRTEIEAFRDHHTAKGSTFKDHNAAFRTWCRNAVKWQSPTQRRNETPTPGPGKREWVKQYHYAGQHWACNPGEFEEGCN